MPADTPTYSVLIPSRDRPELLPHVLRSVLAEAREDVEVVVSDNASAADYAAVVAGFADRRIRLSRSAEPLSVTASWNRALAMARGRYVVMLGDDDALAPGYFAAADAVLRRFEEPDLVYAMAYHYAWPGVIPSSPDGYLARVNNSPLFDAPAPYLLDAARAETLVRKALAFRAHLSFNAQHFLLSRRFIAELAPLGDFYQSPYPDYYACFVSFLKARRIVVDPAPRTLIGIAPRSFGYFHNNQAAEDGAQHFLAPPLDLDFLAGDDAAARAALAMPGNVMLRDWCAAALWARRRLAGERALAVDLRRLRRLQAFELASQAAQDRTLPADRFWATLAGLGPVEAAAARRFYRLLRTLRRAPGLEFRQLAWSVRQMQQLHGPARVEFLDIGKHETIADALAWLAQDPQGRAAPPPPAPRPPPPPSLRQRLAARRAALRGLLAPKARQLLTLGFNQARRVRRHLRDYPRLEALVMPPARVALRLALPRLLPGPAAPPPEPAEEFTPAAPGDRALLRLARRAPAVAARFLPFAPLNVALDEALGAAPALNILLPSLRREHATGGPNTAFLLGCLLAQRGTPVRFVGTDVPNEPTPDWLLEHLSKLAGLDAAQLPLSFANGADRTRPLGFGRNHAVLATAWWTAQMAREVVAVLQAPHFYYLIQDYEPFFYGASENWVQAQATYALPHVPIINTSLLRDHLVATGSGRFADPAFAQQALVFEPAVDRGRFRPPGPRAPEAPRRLLVYARPSHPRNLFGPAVAALSAAVEAGLFADGPWEFLGMGEAFEPVPLGRGQELRPAPWLGFDAYAEQMRSADILLSPMLSPHPSYPPLEMAACGGVVVTTAFGPKTTARMAALSPLILAAEPSVEPMLAALRQARRLADDANRPAGGLTLPGSWTESLAPLTPALLDRLAKDGLRLDAPALGLPAPVHSTARALAGMHGAYHRARRAAAGPRYRPAGTPGLLSLVTTVYDTDPGQLADLAHSLFAQDTPPDFEWVLLDNGSRNAGTRAVLARIAGDPRVRLARVERNLGIVGGMRRCLEQARHRYIVPVDSDDLLAPHALRTLAAVLEQAGFPALAYTDEDKFDAQGHRDLYCKPDWDPVLFAHSCYIAHLTALDRGLALALGCYGDPAVEGSHDWDSFTRFALAGHVPAHLAECTYSWRMHAGSTAQDIGAKSYIVDSQKAVLRRFLDGVGQVGRIGVAQSPLFPETPDWRLALHGPVVPPPTLTLVRDAAGLLPVAALRAGLAALPADAAWVHLHDPACRVQGDLWPGEAAALAALFPDTAMVGGRLHDDAVVIDGPGAFGFGGFVGSPDRDRSLSDPGHGAQAWKPHSVAAVPAGHAVVRRALLDAALAQLPDGVAPAALGGWLGAIAATRRERVVYSPLIQAQTTAAAWRERTPDTRLAGRFGHLVRNPVGYPAGLDRSGTRAYLPGDASPRAVLPDYPDWLADRLAWRAPAPATGRAPIALLTTVYERTDVALFEETAQAVADQTVPPEEWLVLAHGPVPAALDGVLDALAAEGRIRLLRLPENLGIAGGLRHCLERATAPYCLPLDADDLLTPDALALLAARLAEEPAARLVYSDEDHLIGGVPLHPWHRPDHDPALLLAHSSVWHAIAYHRETALGLGVYTDKAAEYAQDWDTLLRFHRAGHAPAHLPEVIYHWRQHERSLSHSGATFAGSVQSVRHLLGRIAEEAGLAGRCTVAPDPFRSNGTAFRLLRTAEAMPPVALLNLGVRAAPPCEELAPAPAFAAGLTLPPDRGTEGLARLRTAVAEVAAPFVLLLSAGVTLADWRGLRQAVLQLELLPEAIAVGGPLLDAAGNLLAGPVVALPDGGLLDPLAGLPLANPGPFSMAHRPHCVSLLGPDLLLARTDVLRAVLEAAPASATLRGLGALLGVSAARAQQRLVHEPLFPAVVTAPGQLLGDPVAGLEPGWSALGGAALPGRHGLAPLSWHRLHHR